MKEVQFDIKEVVNRLSNKIGQLEADLAFERSATDAYAKRVEKLEAKLNEKQKR